MTASRLYVTALHTVPGIAEAWLVDVHVPARCACGEPADTALVLHLVGVDDLRVNLCPAHLVEMTR